MAKKNHLAKLVLNRPGNYNLPLGRGCDYENNEILPQRVSGYSDIMWQVHDSVGPENAGLPCHPTRIHTSRPWAPSMQQMPAYNIFPKVVGLYNQPFQGM